MIIKWIPNTLTCLNLFIGILGIINIFHGTDQHTIFFISIACLFDFLDGFTARLLNVTQKYGKQLDSLADIVSFGVLPTLYLYQTSYTANNHIWISYSTLLIAVFSALRLAKFNLDPEQTKVFTGLPTPANAIMISTVYMLPFGTHPLFILSLSLISAFLLVSKIRLISFKFDSWQWRENLFEYVLLLIFVLSFILFKTKGMLLIIPTYVIVSIVKMIKK